MGKLIDCPFKKSSKKKEEGKERKNAMKGLNPKRAREEQEKIARFSID